MFFENDSDTFLEVHSKYTLLQPLQYRHGQIKASRGSHKAEMIIYIYLDAFTHISREARMRELLLHTYSINGKVDVFIKNLLNSVT